MTLFKFIENYLNPQAHIFVSDAKGNIIFDGKAEDVPSWIFRKEFEKIESFGELPEVIINVK